MLKFEQWREERLRTDQRYEELRLSSERLYSLRKSSDEKLTHRADGKTYSLVTLRVCIYLESEYEYQVGTHQHRPHVSLMIDEHDRGTANNPLAVLTESELTKVIEIKAMIRKWIAGEGDLLPSDVSTFGLIIE